MSITDLKSNIENRIKKIEEDVQISINSHWKLIGILEEAKRIYDDIKDIHDTLSQVQAEPKVIKPEDL